MKTCQLFTPNDANKALPLVRKIVEDILNTGQSLRDLSLQLGEAFDDDSEVQDLFYQLRENLTELENMGCQYNDYSFSVALVDFPSVIEGEDVYLCWRSDENEIRYYHRVNDTYDGRQPIPDSYFEHKRQLNHVG